MSQATTCWYKGKKNEKKKSVEEVKGYCSKHTQDPSSSPRTRRSNGQNDPTTLFLWTGVWTSEWLSSEIQSLKLSQGSLTSHIASETSIASGNNEKQIRNKIRTWKPLVLYEKGFYCSNSGLQESEIWDLVWKQTPDFSAVLIPSLTLYPSWLMKLKRTNVTTDLRPCTVYQS